MEKGVKQGKSSYLLLSMKKDQANKTNVERVYRWRPLAWEPSLNGSGIDPQLVQGCQSMTLHIELCTFPMHLQCISEALLHTLMHCVLDSTCYATPHCPLHLCLCTCHLHLFVCLPLSPAHMLLVLFVCFPFWIGSIN